MHKFLALLIVLFPFALYASDAPYAKNPPEIVHYFKNRPPLGTGALHWLTLKVYDSALWTPTAQWDPKHLFALSITYDISIASEDLVKTTLEEMQRLRPELEEEKLQGYAEALQGFFPNVAPRDRITALFVPQGTSTKVIFYYNGVETGAKKDGAFADAFAAIWFDENTKEPKLRKKLLNEN